jgi:hypothetical protein
MVCLSYLGKNRHGKFLRVILFRHPKAGRDPEGQQPHIGSLAVLVGCLRPKHNVFVYRHVGAPKAQDRSKRKTAVSARPPLN